MNNNNLINKTVIVLSLWKHIAISIIVFIAILVNCLGDKVDPMDNSINKSRQIVKHLEVCDTSHNGFRVVYVTKNSVTKERFEEIQSRAHIVQAFETLKKDARRHLGNMLYTDIYEFADFALKYDCDKDILIHNIFVFGHDKCKLYLQHNPGLPDCCTSYNPNTDQGILYLKSDDIYFHISTKKIYRYWKCAGLYSASPADEQFSHFTRKERIR